MISNLWTKREKFLLYIGSFSPYILFQNFRMFKMDCASNYLIPCWLQPLKMSTKYNPTFVLFLNPPSNKIGPLRTKTSLYFSLFFCLSFYLSIHFSPLVGDRCVKNESKRTCAPHWEVKPFNNMIENCQCSSLIQQFWAKLLRTPSWLICFL